MAKQQTTISLWRPTLERLERLLQVIRPQTTRSALLDELVRKEAQRLRIEGECPTGESHD